ncbi:hypothetical protein [Rhizobium rhizogenes]|uniref:hypothetical protein n=1 Tax=Rhizobium rhizogenes TaxID=359 RepID=UPI00227154FF|nr:hypothetical protein [Rhizobium rhizogenes]
MATEQAALPLARLGGADGLRPGLGVIIAMGESWRDGHPASFVLAICVPTALLFLVSWWKSDAPWRWRWGGDKGNSNGK